MPGQELRPRRDSRIVETGTSGQVFGAPSHPYTRALLGAVPAPEPGARRERPILQCDVPDPIRPPSGCHFRTRCWKAQARCADEVPVLVDRPGTGHPVACHFPEVREAEIPEPAQS